MKYLCNTRNLDAPRTGVQRYTEKILFHSHSYFDTIKPKPGFCRGPRGHVWEQVVLPFYSKGKLLFSPANSGPVFVKNQIVTIHDVSPLDHPEWNSTSFANWYKTLIPKLVENVQGVITDSIFSKDRILAHCEVNEEKIRPIHLAAAEIFSPRPQHQVSNFLKEKRIPQERYFLVAGSLDPRKNLKTVIDAWHVLQNSSAIDCNLLIVGDRADLKIFNKNKLVCEREFQRNPRIFYTGRINDEQLACAYSGAVASINVSLYEGFGLPALESMACGTGIICSNEGALLEVSGGAGFMINPRASNELALAMELIFRNSGLKSELDTKGTKRARQFSWAKTAEKTIEFLDSQTDSLDQH